MAYADIAFLTVNNT